MSQAFKLSIQSKIDGTWERVERVVRGAILDTYSDVIQRSPFDTGRFIGNWTVAYGNPDLSTKGVSSRGAALQAGESKLATYKAGLYVYLTNNLPYAKRLEEGWSDQAPNGIVSLATQNFRKYLINRAKSA